MILKKKIEDNFTSVHNAFLRDQNLSMTARGLLITMLSLKDDWNFSIKGLASILKADGERRIASALKELENHEYLCRERKCSEETGRVIDWVYTVSDEKLPEDILRYSFRRKGKRQEEADIDDVEKVAPDCAYPHVHNADVGVSDLEYPHPEEPYLNSLGIYNTNNNQISKKEKLFCLNINQSNPDSADKSTADGYDSIEINKQIINENICYDSLMFDYRDPECKSPGSAEILTEIRDIMLECVCSGKKTIRVHGDDIPVERVRAVMLSLNSEHVLYVMECMNETSKEIKSIHAYLITALYNAPKTINSYYMTKANHTLYGKEEPAEKTYVYANIKPRF